MYDLRIFLVWLVLGFLLYLIAIRPERSESIRSEENIKEPGDVNNRFLWDREKTQAEINMIDSLRDTGFVEAYDAQNPGTHVEPAGLLPKDLMIDLGVVPLRLEDNVLVLAMIDPFDLNAVDIVREVSQREIRPVMIAQKDFRILIGKNQVKS